MPSDERIEEVEGSILNTAGLTVDNLWDRILGEGLNEWERLNRQGLSGSEMQSAIDEFLNGLSNKYVDGQANEAANVAYAEGRSAEVLTLADTGEITWVIRSEIMDASICSFCKTVDGIVVMVGTAAYDYYKPPAGCLGGKRCRGMYVPGVGEIPEEAKFPPEQAPPTERQLALPYAEDPTPRPNEVEQFTERVREWCARLDAMYDGGLRAFVEDHPDGIGDFDERLRDPELMKDVMRVAWEAMLAKFNSRYPWIVDGEELDQFDVFMMSEWGNSPQGRHTALIKNGLRLAWGETLDEATWGTLRMTTEGEAASLERYLDWMFQNVTTGLPSRNAMSRAFARLAEFVEDQLPPIGTVSDVTFESEAAAETAAFFRDWLEAHAGIAQCIYRAEAMEDDPAIPLSRAHGYRGRIDDWIDDLLREDSYVPNGASSWTEDRGKMWAFGTSGEAQVMFNSEVPVDRVFGYFREGLDRWPYYAHEDEVILMGNSMIEMAPGTIRILPSAFAPGVREALSTVLGNVSDPQRAENAWQIVSELAPDVYDKLAALADRGWDVRLTDTFGVLSLGDATGPPQRGDVQFPGGDTIDPTPNMPRG